MQKAKAGMKRASFIMLVYLWTTGILRAQDFSENEFRRYTTASGMSHNSVTAILQDSTGYIWIATPSGLNRFNGSRFVQFHSTDDSLSLAAEEVTGMTWLDKHRLALYTAGLHIIDTKTGARRNLFIPYHRQKYLYKFNMIMRQRVTIREMSLLSPVPASIILTNRII